MEQQFGRTQHTQRDMEQQFGRTQRTERDAVLQLFGMAATKGKGHKEKGHKGRGQHLKKGGKYGGSGDSGDSDVVGYELEEMDQIITHGLEDHPKASRFNGLRGVVLETEDKYSCRDMLRVMLLPTDGGRTKTLILHTKYLEPYSSHISKQEPNYDPSVIVDLDF